MTTVLSLSLIKGTCLFLFTSNMASASVWALPRFRSDKFQHLFQHSVVERRQFVGVDVTGQSKVWRLCRLKDWWRHHKFVWAGWIVWWRIGNAVTWTKWNKKENVKYEIFIICTILPFANRYQDIRTFQRDKWREYEVQWAPKTFMRTSNSDRGSNGWWDVPADAQKHQNCGMCQFRRTYHRQIFVCRPSSVSKLNSAEKVASPKWLKFATNRQHLPLRRIWRSIVVGRYLLFPSSFDHQPSISVRFGTNRVMVQGIRKCMP